MTHVELLRYYTTIGFGLNIWRKYFLISLRDHLEHVEDSSLPKVYNQEVKSTLPAQWVLLLTTVISLISVSPFM